MEPKFANRDWPRDGTRFTGGFAHNGLLYLVPGQYNTYFVRLNPPIGRSLT